MYFFAVNDSAIPPPATAGVGEQLRLEVQDALASANRLWLRGRLFVPTLETDKDKPRRWWPRRRKKDEPTPALVHLETRIGGHVLQADVPLLPDGRIEATFTVDLSKCRRGWRMTRNQVSYRGAKAEKCGVALMPPEEMWRPFVVILPLEYTFAADGPEMMLRRESDTPLSAMLRQLEQRHKIAHPVYYLACVPSDNELRQSELALAATNLRWPHGTFVMMPTERERAGTALRTGLERLQWLLEGTEPIVVNREPAFGPLDEDPAPFLVACARDAQGNPFRPTRSSLVPRHPIVFCHGLLAFTTIHMAVPEDVNCFAPMREFLRSRGFRVLFPQVEPTGSVAERAAQLRGQIRAWTSEPVNVIAHSMGGLDARFMITHLDMAEQVRSLTTVATPHRGTYVADWFVANFRQRVPLLLALEAVGINVDGFKDCRLEECKKFNATTPDMPGVRYFSFAGEVPPAKISPALRRGWSLLYPVEGPNDGLVSAQSARWGEFLGTVHADHFAQTPDAVFLRPGEDFDSLGFYTRLIEDLARRGF